MTDSPTILVVDDNPDLCEGVRNLLETGGYRVVIAGNGQQAFELVESTHVDLVALDIMMPGWDGLRTCEQIRKISNMPILMVTELDVPQVIHQAYGVGSQDYLYKPYESWDWPIRIAAILKRAHELGIQPRQIEISGRSVLLTPLEVRLLQVLRLVPSVWVPAGVLFQQTWGYSGEEGIHLVHAAVAQLHQKIEADPGSPTIIRGDDRQRYRIQLES